MHIIPKQVVDLDRAAHIKPKQDEGKNIQTTVNLLYPGEKKELNTKGEERRKAGPSFWRGGGKHTLKNRNNYSERVTY